MAAESQTTTHVLNLPPAYRLVVLETVDSTNEEAKRQAREGAEDGTLIWARSQTAGKGRGGRHWSSPPGNLYLSLILRPDCPPSEAAQLSFVAALGMADAIGSVAPPLIDVQYKWPNDLLFNGRKGAGILLESQIAADGTLEWLVLGCGVNVRSHPGEGAYPATSLVFEGTPALLSEAELLEAFGRHFLAWANRWLDEGFEPIRQRWLRHAKGLGETIEVRLPKETLSGRFAELDTDGALVLELPDGGRRRIAAGEVYFP